MINLGIFFGGPSVEHEVSVITAQQAIAQLQKLDDYHIVPIYIAKDSHWYTGDYLLNVEHFRDLKAVVANATRVNMVKSEKCALLINDPIRHFGQNIIAEVDIAFPMIHGTGGEDGTLQGLLEHMAIPYVGCNVLAASMTMDKVASKLFLQTSGIRVVEGEWFYAHHWIAYSDQVLNDIEQKLTYPMIVKPADIGSSVGIKTAKNRRELTNAINFARQFTTRILVERMLSDMREINISVLGDCEQLVLSVCEEPLTASEILTYEDKYMSEGGSKGMSASKRQIPATLHPNTLKEIQKMSAEAFIALDCAGVVRIDFMIEKSTGLPYINEFNTVPGSLAFYLWEATGVTFLEMLQKAIDAAYRTHRRKTGITRSNSLNLLSKKDLKGLKK
ncbi:D-alanine--D-alanine ligase [Fusibacter paucivorans]|uniref:D-alanine--D-alanine ligase n=1 Tax=Fusibacter paucivorans TaxID=76009 RepID=A0ABS5PLA6_9FIRM|nr:D-alanine--D-alanine ligase family protein [Fusibacter paucivorans]MBS7525843.1 D-alanine--D-alanine ligase [Fusibacter paucivorans]